MSLLSCEVSNKREGEPKVLVFSKTAGFKHASIPAGLAAIQKLGQENGFKVDTTKNAELFNEDNLKQYSAVIFLNTTGNVLDYRQEAAFERYIQAGGGFVGVHAATDTEYDWGWYGKLVGAYFNGHPKIQEAKFLIKDKDFPATEFFKVVLVEFFGIGGGIHLETVLVAQFLNGRDPIGDGSMVETFGLGKNEYPGLAFPFNGLIATANGNQA